MVSKKQIINDLKNKISEDGLNQKQVNNLISGVSIYNNSYSALKNSNLVSLCTEWDEFREIDWKKAYNIMHSDPFLFDGRHLVNKNDLESIGFKTYIIGQP